MAAYDLMFPRIKRTITGNATTTLTLDKYYQGLIIDNQFSAPLTYNIDSQDRIAPAGATRGLMLDERFIQIGITASGYFEIHLF